MHSSRFAFKDIHETMMGISPSMSTSINITDITVGVLKNVRRYTFD
jgi:hypothetical protein